MHPTNVQWPSVMELDILDLMQLLQTPLHNVTLEPNTFSKALAHA